MMGKSGFITPILIGCFSSNVVTSNLKRTIKSLKDRGLLSVERFDKLRSNQVNYYAINYDVLAIIEANISQAIDSIDQLKMSQSSKLKLHQCSSSK